MEVLLFALAIIISMLAGAAIAYYVMLRARGEATPTHTSTPTPTPARRQVKISLMSEEGGCALPIVFDRNPQAGQRKSGTVLGTEKNLSLTMAESESDPHLLLKSGEEPITLGGESTLTPQNMGMRAQMSRIMAEVGFDDRGPFINLDKGFSREGVVITIPRLQSSGRISLTVPVRLHWHIKVEEDEKLAKKGAETFALPAAPSGTKSVKPLGMMAPPKTVPSKAFWLIEVVD